MSEEILIVEDDSDLRPLLEYTFEEAGFETRAVRTGSDALEYLLGEGEPAGIVLDLVMPGIGGLDLLERRSEVETVSEIPVVVVTARDGDGTAEAAFERGAEDYVTKPFQPGELVMRVRRLLE